MKTLIDAVNAVNTFRGEVPTISGVLLYMTMELLVTKREFNECVEEMSSNFGTSEAYSDYKASYKMINDDIKPVTTTYTGEFGYDDKTVAPPVAVYTQKMADDGVMPKVGMECLYSDGKNTTATFIVKYLSEWVVVFEQVSEGYGKGVEICKSINTDVFTCKPLTPPIKLIDGKAYQFDVRDKGGIVCGIYHKYDKRLHVGQEHYFDLMSATNIQLLEVKS